MTVTVTFEKDITVVVKVNLSLTRPLHHSDCYDRRLCKYNKVVLFNYTFFVARKSIFKFTVPLTITGNFNVKATLIFKLIYHVNFLLPLPLHVVSR